jgi:transglutaminase-like putative cysteine protease
MSRCEPKDNRSPRSPVPARESFNDVRLEPPSNEGQSVASFVLTATPAAPFQRYRDFYDNGVHHFEIPSPHASLVIESRAVEKARATHAWVEVWIPTVGWLALDPTHNRQIDETYIKIGAGRDYADVPPVAGYYNGTLERKLEVEVQIEAIAQNCLAQNCHESSQP